MTVGVVSAKGRSLPVSQTVSLEDLIQTDTVINPGNSGGPLLNLAGEVVGIATAIIRGRLSGGQEAEGIGFAVSMSTAIPVAQQLIENGRVIWPWLGIRGVTVTPVIAAQEGLEVEAGVLIASVVPDGPADNGGILANDVIVGLNDNSVNTIRDLQQLLRLGYRVAEEITVHLIRDEQKLALAVTLAEFPREPT